MKDSQKKWIGMGLSTFLVLAIVFFVGRSLQIDGRALFEKILHFPMLPVLGALGWVLAQIGFQVTRLWRLPAPEAGVSWSQCARAFSYGQFVNTFVPVRAGDLVKIVSLRKQSDGRGRGLEGAEATGVILADKVVDTLALASLILVALAVASSELGLFRFSDQLDSLFPVIFGVIGIGGLVFILVRRYSKHLRDRLKPFFEGLRSLKDPRRMRSAFLWGLGCWISELLAIQLLCSGQGYDFSFAQALVVLVVLNIGVAVPVSFANAGTFEASMAFALSQLGVPLTEGVAIAAVHHALQMVGILLWALVCFALKATASKTLAENVN